MHDSHEQTEWGGIMGFLQNQHDLIAALAAKLAPGDSLLARVLENSNTITNTDAEVAFDKGYVVPAGRMNDPQRLWLVRAGGVHTPSGTVSLRTRLKFGGTTIFDTGAMETNSNLNRWSSQWLIGVTATGAGGSVRVALVAADGYRLAVNVGATDTAVDLTAEANLHGGEREYRRPRVLRGRGDGLTARLESFQSSPLIYNLINM